MPIDETAAAGRLQAEEYPMGPLPHAINEEHPTCGISFVRAVTALFRSESGIDPRPTPIRTIRSLLTSSWLNLLLVFVPVMFVARFVQGNPSSKVFAFAFLGLLPCAKIFGLAMEDLSLRADENTGRFIRVLGGNSLELISGIIAIIQCQLEVLQASIVGSILINILLVMGCAFFAGGTKYQELGYGSSNAITFGHILMLGTIAALLPTIFAASFGGGTGPDLEYTRVSIVKISRAVSVALLFCYSIFCFFQLYSHSSLFNRKSNDVTKSKKYEPRAKKTKPVPTAVETVIDTEAGYEEEEEEPQIRFKVLVVILVLGATLVSALSEYLVSSLSALTDESSLTKQWVGLILIPLAGTFARHDLMEAMKYSMQDNLTDSLALSLGSSVNLSMFIQPILIILAWILKKNLSLLYDPFETMVMNRWTKPWSILTISRSLKTLFLSVLVVNLYIIQGKGEFLAGASLIVLYVLIVRFFFACTSSTLTILQAISFWFYTGTHVFSNLLLTC
ncbi:hypothetical protein DFH08DRAFT_1089469 [Mycena albidolilacea]|uniref:Sodium/calcium exchanger membrane region domain-containing protein n=1 Tax=Mycena albidolilacea TaxID=1033008 RepID=A0AAD6Z193_9AGAR|nr:hypothetical protein DFH08DRAFT_1089469 [Mycena albidolilacea]